MSPPSKASSPFPLALSITTILTTGLALIFAATNIRWTISTGETLPLAWPYTNTALVLTFTIIWPILHRQLPWNLAAIFIAAIPALTVSAFLSNIPPSLIVPTLLFQLALALFSMALLTRFPRTAPSLLATLALVTPIALYIASDFFNLTTPVWSWSIPLITIARLSQPQIPPAFWYTTALYFTIALTLLLLPKPKRSPGFSTSL